MARASQPHHSIIGSKDRESNPAFKLAINVPNLRARPFESEEFTQTYC
jgi:hypothetical protein